MDDGVREIGGVSVVDSEEKPRLLIVREARGKPMIIVGAQSYDTLLTPDEARRLALHLNMLATRVEDRARP